MRYSDVEGNAVCFGAMGVGVLCDPLMCYPPYTAPRFNAVSFGAMGVEILCDPLLYPAYTAPRLNAARFGSMGADVRATLYCAASHPRSAARVNAAYFDPFYGGEYRRYPYTLRPALVLSLCCGFGGWFPSYCCCLGRSLHTAF